jgi:tRNA threonylcarbamoyladenosine biosynthesis protein TsaB
MLLLAIDTAGPNCAAALARADVGESVILSHREERIGRGHAERLMPLIDAVLQEARASYADLERIAVTTGPGSFTGVRVGVAVARGLALALGIPAVGIGSLDALALPVTRSHVRGTAVAVLDAKRGEIYARAQDLASGAVLVASTAAPVRETAERLAGAARPLLLVGAGAPLLAAAFPEAVELVGTAEFPDTADVARLGAAEAGAGLPVPLYARGADAKPQAGSAVARL